MESGLPLPAEIWERTPPEAQALILALQRQLEELSERVRRLEAELAKFSRKSKGRKASKPAPPRPWPS